MNDKPLVKDQIADMLWSMIEASLEMVNLFNSEKFTCFLTLGRDIQEMSCSITSIAKERDTTESFYQTLWKMTGNIAYSVSRILIAVEDANEKNLNFAAKKLEFELIPLCRATYAFFRYHAQIKNTFQSVEQWMEEEGKELCKNFYLEEAKRTGKYKYDLSIRVLAYNNLEYTKMCVDSVKRCLPKNLTYEIILINHGSSDSTREFFESIQPDKQIDGLYNGGMGIAEGYIYEGKYPVFISNDVILTPPVFNLMFDAMEHDPSIGILLPMTSNISNYQSPEHNAIALEYTDITQLYEKIEEFSEVDRRKEEVRFRLCTPLFTVSPDIHDEIYFYLLILSDMLAFPDDAISLVCRRKGYKNVLLKNAYCHHFASVTIRNEKMDQERYDNGRKSFLEAFGIDPWGKGYAWSYDLFSRIKCNKADASRILGIGCGMGSDPLKIQQDLKETTGNTNVTITNVTRVSRHATDLKALSDEFYEYKDRSEIFDLVSGKFDYIIVEDDLQNDMDFVLKLYDMLTVGGELILFVTKQDTGLERDLKNHFTDHLTEIGEVICIEKDIDRPLDLSAIGRFMMIRK